ncbi:multidrug resistance protein MdtO [Duganella sp. CF458]|uniref:FUSC family protein n=1 Tax=Duganella sp. CF458 TaxID=1884368 RepID=UPI0008EBEC0C|nr:FUSC family protein [Duganella sp. CF458]SFG78489.1 multidrug resistance protein MdtO [Duganella sp. CF458]
MESLTARIRNELAPFPGRMDAVWRLLASCTVVIVCSMALQVPSLSLSLIMVFFTAQENTVLTRMSGMVLIIGSILSVLASILLLKFFIDAPMLRILGAALVAFCGMYFMRASRFGGIGFLVALIVVYGQSMADIYNDPEVMTRALLWVGVATTYPIVVTMIIQRLFRPALPVKLLVEEYGRQLDEVEHQLDARIAGVAAPAFHSGRVGRGVLALQRQLAFASLGGKERTAARAAAVSRLHAAAAQLARLAPFELSKEERRQMMAIREACKSLRVCLGHDTAFKLADVVPQCPAPLAHGAILREMARALCAAAEVDADAAATSDVATAAQPLAPAAATGNPLRIVHLKFAFKAVLAAISTYIIYTGLQWPGIHTAMQTCIILALPSLGATTHKGITRLLGCCLGSLAALVATVFIVPHLDSIVGLLAMSLPIIALGAWIAVGSPRFNYIGVQMMFAFALAQLGSFGPVTDVTEIRDRLVGILLGLAVSITVYTLLWPERGGQALKSALSQLRKAVAACAHADHRHIGAARLQAWALLNQCRELQARVALEPGWRDRNARRIANVLAQAEEKLAMQQARH